MGLPEHFGRRKRYIFATILDRIRQKTLSWKNRFLSGAGKEILLKAVLTSMPAYTMSCFKLPLSLCKQIQSLLTRFWWDANPDQRKMCWVAWSTLTLPKYAGGLGFRDIETFNDALLAKIGWRLIKSPDSLIAQVLLGKYARSSSFLDCPTPSTMSHGWRGILAGREILRKGLGWIVGGGDKIRVWRDPWLSCQSPLIPIGPMSEKDQELKVSDLLCPISNAWDKDKIKRHIPHYEEHILSIITSAAPSQDSLAWLFDKSGEYTTKTGYGAGMGLPEQSEPPTPSFNWIKNIWNVNTPPKIKNFLWKLVRKAIPVSSNLVRRGLPAFDCKSCHQEEDDLHVFLCCSMANQVWEIAPLAVRPQESTPSVAALIELGHTLTALPPTGVSVPLWPWVLWNLWKARNKLCFENRTFSAMEIIVKAISDAREWQDAQPSPPLQDIPQAPNLLLPNRRTFTPPQGTLLCLVDGAWDAVSRNCGTGGNFSGEGSSAYPNPISDSRRLVSSALMAECLAIRSAVMYAALLNIKSLMILSDSQSLVKLLKERGSVPALFGILFDIYHFSSLFDVISFSYVPRSSNVMADSVAKSALSLLNLTSSNGE